jgi:hypothetical protein
VFLGHLVLDAIGTRMLCLGALQENDQVPTGARYADGHRRHSFYKPTAKITLSAQKNRRHSCIYADGDRRHNGHRRFTG